MLHIFTKKQRIVLKMCNGYNAQSYGKYTVGQKYYDVDVISIKSFYFLFTQFFFANMFFLLVSRIDV